MFRLSSRLPFRTARSLVLAASLAASPALAAGAPLPDVSGARHLVSIGGSVTEIIYALGAEDRLVARDTTSLFPPSALALPDVGYIRALSPEGVLSTGPDAILTLEGSGPPEALEVLRQAGVPIVTVPEDYSGEGVLRKVEIVGQALGLADKAADLSASLRDALARAEEQAATRESDLKVLFVLSLSGGNVMAAGEHTAAAGIMKLAHLTNAVSGFGGYKPLTPEAITEAAPDVILMMNNGGDHAASRETVLAHPVLGLTPAARNNRILALDGLYLLGFGPRTAEAADELSRTVAEWAAEGAGQ